LLVFCAYCAMHRSSASAEVEETEHWSVLFEGESAWAVAMQT
jgi:hypothetical protein